MKKLYCAVVAYTVLGLLGGLYFRELTKAESFTGDTQLAVVHTHLLTLGTIVLLLVMLLERAFALSRSRWFSPFFWTYNVGLVVTAGVLAVHGTMTVLDGPTLGDSTSAMISGIAGLGHILLTVGLACLLVALGKGIKTKDELPQRAVRV
jgi:hypothetical protein